MGLLFFLRARVIEAASGSVRLIAPIHAPNLIGSLDFSDIRLRTDFYRRSRVRRRHFKRNPISRSAWYGRTNRSNRKKLAD